MQAFSPRPDISGRIKLFSPRLSVVIAALNVERTLPETLDSLLAQDVPFAWEIVLSDNGSTDRTRAIFEDFARRHPNIATRLVDAGDRRGKSHALNRGIEAAAADRLLFLDGDDTFEPGYLAAMDAALDRHDIVAARLDVNRLNTETTARSRPVGQVRELWRTSFRPNYPHAGGGTLGLHRHVFEAIGDFDTSLSSLEDNDFCIRVARKGYTIALVPEAVLKYRYRKLPQEVYRQYFTYWRTDALLHRRYGDPTPLADAAAGWFSLAFELARFEARNVLRHLGVLRLAPEEVYHLRSRLGVLRGQAAGSVLERVAPASRPLGGRAGQRLTRLALSAAAPLAPSTVAVRTKEKLLALTFDDGPDPETTPVLLDLLAQKGAKATFFLIGSRAARYPDLVARIAAEGHAIGNHTWSHRSLPTLAPREVEAELARTKALLAPHGQDLMRPPFGDQTIETCRIARRLGYSVVPWSVAVGDWQDDPADTLLERILAGARPGAILLLHDTLFSAEDPGYRDRGPTLEAVSSAIDALPDYRFVTVDDLLRAGRPVEQMWLKTSPPEQLESLQDIDLQRPAAAFHPGPGERRRAAAG